ncbi:glutathione S-transferase family protein [Sulfuriflexus mobilis]|uniref:glutathione S-transferase family protein n=1 Tax=Sulfuriflexus mobilis TaxID=1811807 RepID=UPI000F81E871|nr:glutathione S-transferase family protein [Sulfuriflexus mobilis]
MAYEIYWGAGSPYSWRALLGLEVKGLNYDSRLLEFSKQEHQAPEMLLMNPRGQLPILKDGDISVYESVAILAYLDRKHPERPLFGTTARETSHIWQRVFEIENYLREAIDGIVRPVFFDDVSDNLYSIEKSASYVRAEFKTLEALLEKSDYIAGERISAADIVLFPFIQALLRAMLLKEAESLDLDLKHLEKNYPSIASWITRIESIPGYDNTYPPNWRV